MKLIARMFYLSGVLCMGVLSVHNEGVRILFLGYFYVLIGMCLLAILLTSLIGMHDPEKLKEAKLEKPTISALPVRVILFGWFIYQDMTHLTVVVGLAIFLIHMVYQIRKGFIGEDQ